MAAIGPIPDSFKSSYEAFETYPRKLICQTTYRDAADGYVSRMDTAEQELFVSDECDIEIPFLELLPSGRGRPLPIFSTS